MAVSFTALCLLEDVVRMQLISSYIRTADFDVCAQNALVFNVPLKLVEAISEQLKSIESRTLEQCLIFIL